MKNVRRVLLLIFTVLIMSACDTQTDDSQDALSSLQDIKNSGVLLWGADVIGGVPYVYEDPDNPGTYIGFEMDIAKAIAEALGVEQELVIRAWDSLIPELQRGAYHLAMNGLEDTESRNKIVQFSEPYFVYSQQISVRNETSDIKILDDLKGKRVGTLSGSAAEDLLRSRPDIKVSINPEIIYSYKDLEDGKVDAVLLDTPIAAAYGAANPKLKNVGAPFSQGQYVIAFRDEDVELKAAVDAILIDLKQSGEMARIYRKWGIMNTDQNRIGIQ